jgi:hypothetical protein
MPTVLLDVTAREQATAVLQRVQAQLALQSTTVTSLAAANDRAALILARYQQATEKAALAEEGRQRIMALATSTAEQQVRALDNETAAILRTASAGQRMVDMLSQQATAQQRAADAAQRTADQQDAAIERQVAAYDRQAQAAQDAADRQAAAAQRATDAMVRAATRGVNLVGGVGTGAYGPVDPSAALVARATRGINVYGGVGAGAYGPALPTEPSRGGFLGGEATAYLKNLALYGIGYQAAFAGLGAVQQSISNNVGLSQLIGQTAAQTPQPGLNPDQYMKQLDAYARKTAGTGQWQYNASQVLQGAYNFLSVGGYSVPQAEALNQYALGLSQIGGAQDTTGASTALMAMLQGFGKGTNVNQTARGYANLLQAGANVGAYTIPQIATTLPRANLFGLRQQGFDPQFIMAAMAAASATGVDAAQTAQDLGALGAVLFKPSPGQQGWARALHMNIGPGAFKQAGGAMAWFQQLQQHLSRTSAPNQQLALAGLFGRQDAAALIDEIFSGTGSTSFANIYRAMGRSQRGGGAYGAALSVESRTPGQKLQDSLDKLSTAFDDATTRLVPVLADAASKAADVLLLLANQGQKTSQNPAGATWIDTLRAFLTPGSPGFGNIDKARDMAARGQAATGSWAAAGSALDATVRNIEAFTRWLVGEAPPTAARPRTAAETTFPTPLATGAPLTVPHFFAGPTPPGMTRAAAPPGGGPAPTAPTQDAAAAANARIADQVNANINARIGMTGRGGANAPTPEMQRWANNITAGIAQGWDPNRLQSALGLYIQAVHANAGLTGSQQLADIARETKLVAGHLAGVRGAAALAPPFAQLQPGMGGLEAGFQNTVARFGSGVDPQTAEIRRLQAELRQANTKITGLLQQIHDLLAMQGRAWGPTATPTLLAGTGTNRIPHR